MPLLRDAEPSPLLEQVILPLIPWVLMLLFVLVWFLVRLRSRTTAKLLPTEQVTAARFERFSDDIRHSMRIANREAQRHRQPLIDTPYLLLAMVKEPTGLAGTLLRQRGLTRRSVRRAVRPATLPPRSVDSFDNKLPLSPRVDVVVERAVDLAVKEKHQSVGTGGVLLSMLRHDQTTTELLRSLTIACEELEQTLEKYLHRFMVEAPGQVLHLEDVRPTENETSR